MYLATQDSTYSIVVSHSQAPFCLRFRIEQEPKGGGRKQFGHARLTIILYLLARALYNKHVQIAVPTPTQLGTVHKDSLSGKTHVGGTWSYCQLT